jgi:hypothetical protein
MATVMLLNVLIIPPFSSYRSEVVLEEILNVDALGHYQGQGGP